jgi:FKBP-type peptidyl-prolyl cis-trans isomerase FkpA
MKLFLLASTFCLFTTALLAQPGNKKPVVKSGTVKTTPKPTAASLKDKASFDLGQILANNILTRDLDQIELQIGPLNKEQVKKGMLQRLSSGKMSQPIAQCDNTIKQYQAQNAPPPPPPSPAVGIAIASGKAFVDSVAATPGAMKTASGIVYKVKIPATGPKPTSPTDRVSVYYLGTFINGMRFDGNIGNPKPITFALNGVIAGWTEGVQLMETGATYTFYIPYNLAYGANDYNGIPGGSTLCFDIQLVGVNMPE